jgi:putative membrane protein
MSRWAGPAWARRLRSVGSEPDPRFSFANERTFLAWIRTALALVAGGVAIEAFADQIGSDGLRRGLAVGLIGVGGLLAATAFSRWYRAERALRADDPLPLPALAPFLGYGLALGAVVALVIVVAR